MRPSTLPHIHPHSAPQDLCEEPLSLTKEGIPSLLDDHSIALDRSSPPMGTVSERTLSPVGPRTDYDVIVSVVLPFATRNISRIAQSRCVDKRAKLVTE